MADYYWVGGSGTWNNINVVNWSNTSGGAAPAYANPPSSADNVFFDANSNSGTGAFTVTMASVNAICNNFTVSGLDGTMTLAGTVGLDIYGNLSWPATLFTRSYTGTTTFRATTTGKTISPNGKTFGANVIFDGVGGGWTLSNALTNSSTVTLTNGSLDLGGFTLSCFSFASNNSNTRTLAFNGGSISITGTSTAGNQTLWNLPTLTGFSYTGTSTVNVPNASTGASFTRTFNHGGTAGGSETNAINLSIQAGGASSVAILGSYLNLNLTGCTSNVTNATRNIYGNLTAPDNTWTSGTSTTNFLSTSATLRTINIANTFDYPILFGGSGGSWQLQRALSGGNTNANITLLRGSFDSNNYNISCATFDYNNTNTKTLILGTSTVTILSGTSTTGFVGSNTNTTYNVINSTIEFSLGVTSRCFSGGSGGTDGNQFGTVTVAASSGGSLYLGNGATTARCTTLSNTAGLTFTLVNACTAAFTVTTFAMTGQSGSTVSIISNSLGTARNLKQASGTVVANFMNIRDSNAIGGASWNAYNSVNSGNNTGWKFLGGTGNFLTFF